MATKDERIKEKRERAFAMQRGVSGEPVVTQANYQQEISSALNYYSKNSSYKERRSWLEKYLLSKNDIQAANLFEKAQDFHVAQIGSIARLLLRGQHVSPEHIELIKSKQQEIVEYLDEKKKEEEKAKQLNPALKVDKSAAVLTHALTIIDLEIDKFVTTKNSDFNPKVFVATTAGMNGPVMKKLQEIYNRLLAELESDDEQIQEGYSYFSKIEFRKFKEFVSNIVNSLGTQRVTVRKQRVKKVKPPEVQAARMSYRKEPFQMGVEQLTGIHPKNIIGAKELWVFNTKNRQLTVFKSDEGLQVHGTKVMNFNTATSKVKRLRKPESFFTSFARKTLNELFDKVNATEYKPNGRITEDMLLLKVF